MYGLEATKLFRQEWQEDIRRFMPRRYSMPPWSYPADTAPIQSIAHMKMCVGGITVPNQNHSNWFIAGNMFRSYGSRVYAVTPELVTDLGRTSIKGLHMPALRWPLKSFCIAFPQETLLLNDTDGYLTGMLVSYNADAEDMHAVSRLMGVDYGQDTSDPDKFIVCSATSSGSAYSCNTYVDDFSLDKLDEMDFQTTMPTGMHLNTIEPGDRESSRKLVEIFVKVLSYMNARPSDLEPGALKAKAKNKSKKQGPKPDWWKPWVLGLDRRKQPKIVAGTNPGVGERGSSIPHWRCGHWRHVRHGKGREQTKITWIEPTMVNKDKA